MKPPHNGARMRRTNAGSITCIAVAALALAFSGPAAAATLHVTSGGDGATGPTLRNVIASASPGDTVLIAPDVDPSLTQGQIVIDKNLTIQGQGAHRTTISANAVNRHFRIGFMNPAAQVRIEGVTLTGGQAFHGAAGATGQPGTPGSGGGAIFNEASLTLFKVALIGNAAGHGGLGGDGGSGPGGDGGAGGAGGAILSAGTLVVDSSALVDNGAGEGGDGGNGATNTGDGGGGGSGGAISSSGTTTIINTTLSQNRAGDGGDGGDAGNGGDGGDGGDGGGISIVSALGQVTASTIHDNGAGDGGNGGSGAVFVNGDGGGAGDFGAISGSALVKATILAANSFGDPGPANTTPPGSAGGVGAPGTAENCSPGVVDGGFNIAFITAGIVADVTQASATTILCSIPRVRRTMVAPLPRSPLARRARRETRFRSATPPA